MADCKDAIKENKAPEQNKRMELADNSAIIQIIKKIIIACTNDEPTTIICLKIILSL